MRGRLLAMRAVAGMLALPGVAAADKANDTLRIVGRGAIPNVDPYSADDQARDPDEIPRFYLDSWN
jgi:hypothetical protein